MRNKLLMTLALLITAATGAWAQQKYNVTFSGFDNASCNTTITDVTLPYSKSFGKTDACSNAYDIDGNSNNEQLVGASFGGDDFTITVKSAFEGTVTVSVGGETDGFDSYGRSITVACVPAEAPITVEPVDGQDNTWTFTQPGYDVVLTPIYAEATVRDYYEETETAYASLKEAFANLKDGDVITLDWNVTLTEQLETPEKESGIDFTIDFNGYTIDGDYGIYLNNYGDRLTFTDSSDSQLGGYKAGDLLGAEGFIYAFDAGRFYVENNTAETLNAYCAAPDSPWELRPGKEFVDLEGGADANDGFTLRVDYKAYELTIGAGKFDTFFDDYNVVLDEGTNISFYTINKINDDRTEAYVTLITSEVIPAGTPILVYNGGEAKQTVKLKVTTTDVNLALNIAPEFKGTAADLEFTDVMMAAADYYALSGGKLFVPVYETGILGKNQCWLQFDYETGDTGGDAPARGITLVFEESEATEIAEVSEATEAGDGAWYDLSGRKLDGEPTAKGVYVKDGKKVVVK